MDAATSSDEAAVSARARCEAAMPRACGDVPSCCRPPPSSRSTGLRARWHLRWLHPSLVSRGYQGPSTARVLVVGASFIGMEVAAYLAQVKKVASVTVVGAEQVSAAPRRRLPASS